MIFEIWTQVSSKRFGLRYLLGRLTIFRRTLGGYHCLLVSVGDLRHRLLYVTRPPLVIHLVLVGALVPTNISLVSSINVCFTWHVRLTLHIYCWLTLVSTTHLACLVCFFSSSRTPTVGDLRHRLLYVTRLLHVTHLLLVVYRPCSYYAPRLLEQSRPTSSRNTCPLRNHPPHIEYAKWRTSQKKERARGI